MEGTTKRRNGDFFEIDVLASNGVELVLVEVKTTLRSEGVTHFLGKLSRFGEWFPEYRDRRVYGAVAYLQGSDSVTRYAERQGLFVIGVSWSNCSKVTPGRRYWPAPSSPFKTGLGGRRSRLDAGRCRSPTR